MTSSKESHDDISFFNYYEYSAHSQGVKVIINHFPDTSQEGKSSHEQVYRVVKIPRFFNEKALKHPEFSTYAPGSEPAAISSPEKDHHGFDRVGAVDSQLFGTDSITPLSLYLSDDEIIKTTKEINVLMANAFEAVSLWNVLEYFFDLMFFWVGEWFFKSRSKRKLDELENLVASINDSITLKEKGLNIVSPRRSGYLSIDYRIPKPI